MTIGARVSSGRKREAEADAAFRTVKMARSVGPDRGRKAHDKERQVIEKTKTNNKKRRARSISLRAENLRLKEELRRMSVRGEDLLELWRQLETALQTLDKNRRRLRSLRLIWRESPSPFLCTLRICGSRSGRPAFSGKSVFGRKTVGR